MIKRFTEYIKETIIIPINIKDDVDDILIDLKDDGFRIDSVDRKFYHPVELYKPIGALQYSIRYIRPIIWDDVKDVVLRLEEYLWRSDSGYSISIEAIGDPELQYARSRSISIDEFITMFEHKKIERLNLYIYSDQEYYEATREGFIDD